MHSNLVCPCLCHISILCSTCPCCIPLVLVEIPNRAIDPPPPIELDDFDEWEVHQILDSRIDCHCKGSGLLYLVEWKGFDNTPMPRVGNT